MNEIKNKWLDAIGTPSYEIPKTAMRLIKRYDFDEYSVELYTQSVGPDYEQRVVMAIPKNCAGACPAVAVPFYFAESMLGYNPENMEEYSEYSAYPMMADLAKRGYITICADAYYITYTQDHDKDGGFPLWEKAGIALRKDHPNWSGVGKLISDTQRMLDALCADSRVDSNRIGIAGHSLGGKMAFYTGCLDDRVKVILASDFGICWEQTNWDDIWYWGDYVNVLKEKGMDHAQLLSVCAPKPFCLIAGEFDNDDSWQLMKKASGYSEDDGRLKIINHATGHTPPRYALEEGYDFIERWI